MKEPLAIPVNDAAHPIFDEYAGTLFERNPAANAYLVHIPEDMSPKDTIELSLTSLASHVVIVAEARSTATVSLSVSGKVASCDVEVFAHEESNLTVLTLQNANGGSFAMMQKGRIDAGARLHWQNVSLGAAKAEQNLISRVIGEHGESTIDWIFYGKGQEKQELLVRNIFDATDGAGEITMKGVSEEKAHVGCEGMIEIGLKGGGTNTYLTQNVLMLDPTSRVDAIPGLEIKTNDVKASHSATVSRVTADDLFYFASRGIPSIEARRMFVIGFLGDLTLKIPDEKIRDEVVALIEEKYQARTA